MIFIIIKSGELLYEFLQKLLQCDAPYHGHPTNFFYKLANQDIFLGLVHKIQHMFSIIRRCVTCLLDFARRRDH